MYNPPAKIGLLVRKGNVEAVHYLLAHGLDPNAVDEHGRSLLCVARQFNQLMMVELLISYGAREDGNSLKHSTRIVH